MQPNQNFYFTYGSEDHPFYGGWTEIKAPDMQTAIDLFRLYHPNKHGDLLNCASVYTQAQFEKTIMWDKKNNLGHGCWEIIELQRTLLS